MKTTPFILYAKLKLKLKNKKARTLIRIPVLISPGFFFYTISFQPQVSPHTNPFNSQRYIVIPRNFHTSPIPLLYNGCFDDAIFTIFFSSRRRLNCLIAVEHVSLHSCWNCIRVIVSYFLKYLASNASISSFV